jgi:hypothetical protein
MLGEDIRWSGFPYLIILLNLAHSDCTQHCKHTQQPRVYLNLYHAYQTGLVCAVALTCSVTASPITTGELNDCRHKQVDAPCVLGSLDSLGLGLAGTCKEEFVSRSPNLSLSDLMRNRPH